MKYAVYSPMTGEYLHSKRNVGWEYGSHGFFAEPKIFKSKKEVDAWLQFNNQTNDLIAVKVKRIEGYEMIDI